MLRASINNIVLVAAVLISVVFFVKYGARSRTFYGDALGYYMYLPATFIYNNVEAMYELPKDKGIDAQVLWYADVMKKKKSETGREVNQYTYGIALMEMPFFFIAHTMEKILGHEGTGYSATYQNFIKISAIFYALMGLLLVYRILKNYFPPSLSLLSIALLFTGTNLFWFTLHQAGMSHIPLFFLYAMLMLITIELHKKPDIGRFIILGLIMGLITIIRPTDILCACIPLLYGVYSKATIREKQLFIKKHRLKIFIVIVAFLLPVIPQLLYWKATTGSYLYYSYTGQYFSYWKHPKIIEGLFHFSNGWLPYSPVMICSLIGLIFYDHFRKWIWCMLLIGPVYVYIIYSWYCYNYLNGLGSRPMIHLYPLLALSFTAFLQFISMKNIFVKAMFAVACILLISVNIGFSRMQSIGIIRSEESNMAYNFRMFFRNEISYEDLFVKDLGETQPRENEVTKISTLSCFNFDDSVSDRFIRDTIFRSRYFYRMQDEVYSPRIKIRYDKQQFKDAKWFKCSGKFMYTQIPDYLMHILVLERPGKLWKGCKIENKVNNTLKRYQFDNYQTNKWATISFYAKIPRTISDGDTIDLFVWNVPGNELFIDDLCLELYK